MPSRSGSRWSRRGSHPTSAAWRGTSAGSPRCLQASGALRRHGDHHQSRIAGRGRRATAASRSTGSAPGRPLSNTPVNPLWMTQVRRLLTRLDDRRGQRPRTGARAGRHRRVHLAGAGCPHLPLRLAGQGAPRSTRCCARTSAMCCRACLRGRPSWSRSLRCRWPTRPVGPTWCRPGVDCELFTPGVARVTRAASHACSTSGASSAPRGGRA